MQRLYRARARREIRRATMKRADAEAIQRKQMQRLYRSRARRGSRRATIKRAVAEAIQNKGPQRDDTGYDEENERRCHTDHPLREQKGNCKESR